MMSNATTVASNGRTFKTAGGDCKSKNLVYAASCKLCDFNNVYTGKSVTELRTRINGHRSKFNNILKAYKRNPNLVLDLEETDDESILGAHIFSVHNIVNIKQFDDTYNFDILHKCAPSNLRKNEQSLIGRMGTRKPFGLNQINSISGG